MNTTEEWDSSGGARWDPEKERECGQALLRVFSHHSHSGAFHTARVAHSYPQSTAGLREALGQAVEVSCFLNVGSTECQRGAVFRKVVRSSLSGDQQCVEFTLPVNICLLRG